jgi:type VI secretion system ImpC/EvpB family protein
VLAAYARHGWLARTCGAARGGAVEDLPTPQGTCPTEAALACDREALWSSLGLLPLAYSPQDGTAVFPGAASCQRPRRQSDAGAAAAAELSARLDYLQCATLFLRRLLVLARAQLGLVRDVAACERCLGEWLAGYVSPGPARTEEERAHRPLAEARVEVREAQGRYSLLVRLRPAWQFEGQDGLLRLVAEVPGGPR